MTVTSTKHTAYLAVHNDLKVKIANVILVHVRGIKDDPPPTREEKSWSAIAAGTHTADSLEAHYMEPTVGDQWVITFDVPGVGSFHSDPAHWDLLKKDDGSKSDYVRIYEDKAGARVMAVHRSDPGAHNEYDSPSVPIHKK